MILPKADTAKRASFLEQLKELKRIEQPIVYLDKSGFKSNDHRGWAYAPRGEACLSQYNWQLKQQTNAVGAVVDDRLLAAGLYDCSINSDVFHG